MRKCVLIPALLLALAVAASPQSRGGFGVGVGRPGFGRPGFGRPALGNGFGFPGRFAGSVALFTGYSDYPVYADYPSGWAGQAPVPLVIVQSNPSPVPSAPPSEPLMIVWQGDRYVRYGGRATANTVRLGEDYSESVASSARSPSAALPSAPAQVDQPQLPPAVLVFRDGHREQVEDYVIASGKLYVRGDYWRDGYWTRTVELAALDLPRTLSTNRENGVNFVLPAAPNMVVTRP
jgi:hypothetical protein